MIDPQIELTRKLESHSLRGLAREWGISASYLHQVVHGERPISDKILVGLGLERIVTYRRRK